MAASGAGGGVVAWYLAGGAPTPVAAYQPIGAASLAASYVNLANPGTFDAAAGVAPTWDAVNGWTFNGTTQYLTTGVVVGSGYTVAIRIVSWTFSTAAVLVGSFTGGNGFYITQGVANERRYRYGTTGVAVTGVATAPGVRTIAGIRGYWYDGSLTEDTMALENIGNSRGLYIGAQNADGVAISFANATVAALVAYSSTLDAATVTAVSAAMAAL